jgi:hypothetical protein
MVLTGLIVHLTAAVFLSLHVIYSRRSLHWLPALFLLPLLASVYYLLAVYLPEARFEQRVRQLAATTRRPPPKSARQAQAVLDYAEAPSLHNRLRLAAALLDDGAVAEALAHYEACLAGPFGDDPDVRRGAARARTLSGQPEGVAELLPQTHADKLADKPANYPAHVSRRYSRA